MLLELKNVSKFYYGKGTVSSGFTKVNLKLDMGEFVAITGESGSGKSTLLNVLSGLDSYEEGEMYINGKETSGYTEKDFENYRKKYIGNILQNFNLVNSYTVYQNIELVLLINGYKKHKIKKKILKVIDEVGLTKYKNTKVSKLSGGQKQRVAIARALIKETPIIVADEPTGNLDSKTAKSIIELLHKVSKDKLVIVVTHNYEHIEKYVTRKIVMNDGKIIEDKKIERTLKPDENLEKNSIKLGDIPKAQNKKKNIGVFNKLRLGVRNTFNIKVKFLLLLAVFLFITVSAFGGYSSLKKQQYEQSNDGYNNFFYNTDERRIVIKKADNSEFNKEDYEKLKNIDNVDYIIENDLFLDRYFNVSTNNLSLYGNFNSINNLDKQITYGRMPEKDNEMVIVGNKNDYYISNAKDTILNSEWDITDNYGKNLTKEKCKIVGIAIKDGNSFNTEFYASQSILNNIQRNINIDFSKIKIEFNDQILSSAYSGSQYRIVPNDNVPEGKAYVSRDLNSMTKKGNAIGYTVKINVKNMYFESNLDVQISKTYTKNTLKSLTGETDFDLHNGEIYINTNDYYNLFNKGNYQSSVFVKDAKIANETVKEIQNLGYKTLYIKDCLMSWDGGYGAIVQTINVLVFIVVGVVLFFISYFIIKIILKSRNVYFSTIRILGATRKNAKSLLRIELFTVLNIAFITVITLIILISNNVIKNAYIQDLITFLKIKDYIIVYILLTLVSILIANRYSKKLFKKSAMSTYRDEEV